MCHIVSSYSLWFIIAVLSWIYTSKLGCKQEDFWHRIFFTGAISGSTWPGGYLRITALKTNISDPEKFFKIEVITSVFIKQISKG